MEMKEYEEFALNVQTICMALNNAVQMSMENPGAEFIFSPLFPDYIYEKKDVKKNIEVLTRVSCIHPLSYFWNCINPEASAVGISCEYDPNYPHNTRRIYYIRFYKAK